MAHAGKEGGGGLAARGRGGGAHHGLAVVRQARRRHAHQATAVGRVGHVEDGAAAAQVRALAPRAARRALGRRPRRAAQAPLQRQRDEQEGRQPVQGHQHAAPVGPAAGGGGLGGGCAVERGAVEGARPVHQHPHEGALVAQGGRRLHPSA